jgi:hypothetical protein
MVVINEQGVKLVGYRRNRSHPMKTYYLSARLDIPDGPVIGIGCVERIEVGQQIRDGADQIQ